MDILIFAAIAVFIFFKLREQLGKVDEDQKRDSIKKFVKERAEISDQNQFDDHVTPGFGTIQPQEVDKKSQEILATLRGDLKSNFELALQKSNLSPIQFLEGAKSAFEIIISSFSIGDLSALKPLLSEKIFLQFKTAVEDRKSKKEVLHTKIISIDEAKIVGAMIEDNFASITVAFRSKQINYIENEQGQVTFGSKTEINSIDDIWMFKRDCSSDNPNWLVVSTQ
ncbi:MAG: calcium-binding protein [Rickettsiaceae bacterium]|jgi:predicted lipid-binding transport protein (Tim44 family)|nr:calcium-binding protein [Rickettsiaceae bacterium]